MFNYENDDAVPVTNYANYEDEAKENVCSCCLQYDQCSGDIDYGWCDKTGTLTRWDAQICKHYKKL